MLSVAGASGVAALAGCSGDGGGSEGTGTSEGSETSEGAGTSGSDGTTVHDATYNDAYNGNPNDLHFNTSGTQNYAWPAGRSMFAPFLKYSFTDDEFLLGALDGLQIDGKEVTLTFREDLQTHLLENTGGATAQHQALMSGDHIDGAVSAFTPPEIADQFPDHVVEVNIPAKWGYGIVFNHDDPPLRPARGPPGRRSHRQLPGAGRQRRPADEVHGSGPVRDHPEGPGVLAR